MGQNGTIHADYVIPFSDHDAPPVVLQVALQLDSERTVVPTAIQPAVDLARLKDESSPLAQADDSFHPLRICFFAHF
jgi:hypothetical protein